MALMQQDRSTCLSLMSDSEMPVLGPQILHPVERELYEGMSSGRKADFLKGRYALKSIVCNSVDRMSDVLIATTNSGKPYTASDPKLFCSISHADGYAAAAVSAHVAVGVDVEKIRDRHPALLRSISDQEEIDRLSSVYPPDIITTVLWTIKEAAAKADEYIYPRSEYKVSSSGRTIVRRGSFAWHVFVTVLPTHISAVAFAM